MKEELANLVRTSICANNLRKRAREDSNPQPSDPKSQRDNGQIRRNAAFTRCFGRPQSYLIQPDGVGNSTFLPQFLPHLELEAASDSAGFQIVICPKW